ncbi:glycerol-3-phosphate dehydrogenase/oxidase [Rubrivivax gelatinosus]|uniref:Putative glycerol-3-phosphate dehydrogenase GlpD n=2 Tax=Rubrivivax gelatinosus TaxID=28068 RepID=I0HKP0_RUBGI|nr:glycerol-3-phosphate dehydrogenase/oxidase [Rubrivivax gelatinosus]BAL93577.1 putative glycerol-3-phosphate dehydrogenase GlpD [Rubrivivax gelatinosus IL144]
MKPANEDRARRWARLAERRDWDLVVVGGGATGLGVALDAAARGFSVALVESHDFAQGTSSRATKLVHGGVRYLAQGNVHLVREALHERAAMLANAPHVAQPLPFVMPGYHWWERGFYGTGLKLYDALAGARGLGATEWLGSARVQALLPGVQPRGLWGGVKYWDGQFDDARYAVLLARTAAARGAVVLNHCAATALLRRDGRVHGVVVRDAETGAEATLSARCVVNAAGVWVDTLRDLDRDDQAPARAPLVAPSQGVHLVVDRRFLPGTHALLVPKTADGRVLFAVPWLGKTILGTTDTPREDLAREPQPFPAEVDFILRESARYLQQAPRREDVRSVWVGLRPLVRHDGEAGDTKALSREHTVLVAASGLVTVTGGKWTTYRAMAEDVLDRCMAQGLLPRRPAGATARLQLVGAAPGRSLAAPPGEHLYGSEAATLRALPGAERWLWRDGDGGLSEAMVRFAARHEAARTVEDVLARRSRLLFLDAAEAGRLAGAVAAILGDELERELDPAPFEALAARYTRLP